MRTPALTLPSRRARLAIVGISAAGALLAAVASVCAIGLMPPRLEPRGIEVGVATAAAMVDPPSHAVDGADGTAGDADGTAVDALTHPYQVDSLIERTDPLAEVMRSPPVIDRVGRRLGVPAGRIAAATQITDSVPPSMIEPDSERRAHEILTSNDPYRLEIQAQPGVPVLAIYAKAPSADEARGLANALVGATNDYLGTVARRQGINPVDQLHLTQLGAARGSVVDPKVRLKVAGLTFLVVFAVTCGALFLLVGLGTSWRRERHVPFAPTLASVRDERAGKVAARRDDWPHTTRVLPWMVAGLIAMVWLVPFNTIAIDISLPIDLKLDRLVLPVIFVTWLLALAVGGRGAPRLRFTHVHAAIAAFAAVACIGVVVNAAELNQELVLDLAIKKVTLLVAFVSTFVIVASVVRGTEVRAFLAFMLVLAVICGLGMLWEYRFGVNFFYDWSSKLLPGFFNALAAPSGFDDLGRRWVVGPAAHGLEAVAMLSMALPIALVGLLDARRWRGRILYGLAAVIIGAAAISTYRKSGLIAPLSAILVVAYFRRGEMLKLAPLAAVGVVVLVLSSFSALDSVAGQFAADRLDVPTVGDRVSDYDAIRPDLLASPALGRGFGSYENSYSPPDYRILDSDLLLRVVETGLIGLAAFLLMIVTVIVVAAPIIRSRDRRRAPPALVAAAGAAAFLVLSALFDEWSFPHAPYVFLVLAGFLAVVVGSDGADVRARSRPTPEVLRANVEAAPRAAETDDGRVPAPV